MEKYFEEFIIKNFATIFKGRLTLYNDHEESKAQQRIMLDDENKQIGRLDLLAKDASGNFVVIELKKGKESDQVIGQLLRYMGWVKEKLCIDTQDVSGLVICKKIDSKLKYALIPVSNRISVKEYTMDFKLID
jgi:restriction system protein